MANIPNECQLLAQRMMLLSIGFLKSWNPVCFKICRVSAHYSRRGRCRQCTEVGQVWNRLSLKDTSWEVLKKRFDTQRYFQCDIFSLFSQRINMNICFVICFEELLIKDICCSKRLLNNNWWWHLPASLPRTNLARVCGFSLNSAICFGILHFFDF